MPRWRRPLSLRFCAVVVGVAAVWFGLTTVAPSQGNRISVGDGNNIERLADVEQLTSRLTIDRPARVGGSGNSRAERTDPVKPATAAPDSGGPPPPSLRCTSNRAAFCEDFESARNTIGNRNGDLSTETFSVARWRSEARNTNPNHVAAATVGGCRSGLTVEFPPNDVLVCEPNTTIRTQHALIATAQQNYGDGSVRLNQPFDIEGRTGAFSFDMALPTYKLLDGFPQVIFTADPMSAPSYLDDNSGGPTPKHGVAVQFRGKCGAGGSAVIIEFDNHTERVVDETSGCPAERIAIDGRLNRFQLLVSQSHVELWASAPSANGTDFGPLALMYRGSISLPFSRGHLYFGVHNHASDKYSDVPSISTRWDNLVFDGPTVPGTNVSQVDDAAARGPEGVDLSYPLTSARSDTFALPRVVVAPNARLLFNTWFDTVKNKNAAGYTVSYRFNGGPWRRAKLTAGELAVVRQGRSGSFSWSVPVDAGDLRNGSNTIEFKGTGFDKGTTARLANIDLVTW